MLHEVDIMNSRLGVTLDLTIEIPGWYRVKGACPARSDRGCRLTVEERPLVCRLYPFQFIGLADGGYIIYLDLETCPHWAIWGTEYQAAKRMFIEYMREVQSAAKSVQGDKAGSNQITADN